MKKLFTLVAILFCCTLVFAQDIIVKTNNDSLHVKVLDVGNDKIRFRKFGTEMEIYKNIVKEIIFANGTHVTVLYDVHHVTTDLNVPDRLHCFKVDFVSPVLNHITVGYECKLKLGKNLEVKAGFIGPRISDAIKPSKGFLIRAGVKFIWLTESIVNGLKYSSPLQGSYLKPEIIFNRYASSEESGMVTYTNYAIGLVFGRQFVLDNFLTFDYSAGVGFGYQNSSYKRISIYDNNNVDINYNYSHIYFGKNLPLILTGGLTIGFVY